MRPANEQLPPGLSLAYFANDVGDAAVRKRVWSFLDAGVLVIGFMYRRDPHFDPAETTWRNVNLGLIEHGHLGKRMLHALVAAARVIKNGRLLGNAHIITARNLDLLALALLGSWCSPGKRACMVYECLDIHDAMTQFGNLSRIYRWLERLALRRVDVLIVSSPAFIHQYFKPTQNFQGKFLIVENKIHFGANPVARPSLETLAEWDSGPMIIVWVGALRCQVSLDLLKGVAKALPERVLIRCAGVIRTQSLPDFHEQIAEYTNITYEGPYAYPTGLAGAYRDAHLVWAHDLNRPGANSDWLLSNRIYEGSYFGVPSLAVADTATGQVVKTRDLGYVLPDKGIHTLVNFIDNVKREDIKRKRKLLLSRPAEDFVISREKVADIVYELANARSRDLPPMPAGRPGC